MKLQDINLALTNITRIHEGLTEDKLRMLLSAAGWEKGDVEDAILMWKNGDIGKSPSDLPTQLHEKIESVHTPSFIENIQSKALDPEEKNPKSESNSISPIASGLNNGAEIKIDQTTPQTKEKIVEKAVVIGEPKENSKPFPLKVDQVIVKSDSKKSIPLDSFDDHLPHNLPLRPYESSYVTVPFSDYKKRFVPPVSSQPVAVAPIRAGRDSEVKAPDISLPSYEEEKMSAPLHTEDKALVLIASGLFLVLMVLLGYMYTNGRL